MWDIETMVLPVWKKSGHSLLGTLALLKKLDPLQRDLVLFVLRNGRVTQNQVAAALRASPGAVENGLGELVEMGLFVPSRLHNLVFYDLELKRYSALRPERLPSGPVIPLIYHFNLLSDTARLEGFRKAIDQVVREGDVVLDLGCGTAVLSIFASRRAAHVFALEVDPEVADAAEFFVKELGLERKITIVNDDATKVVLPRKADVCVCEMLDTALIAEQQVPAVNHAVENLVTECPRFIPRSARTGAQIVCVDYTFSGLEFALPHFEGFGAREHSQSLSETVTYHEIQFDRANETEFNAVIPVPIERSGRANGLRLVTTVELTPSVSLQPSPWLNPPLVLPLPERALQRDETVSVRLGYELGGGLHTLDYDWADGGSADDR